MQCCLLQYSLLKHMLLAYWQIHHGLPQLVISKPTHKSSRDSSRKATRKWQAFPSAGDLSYQHTLWAHYANMSLIRNAGYKPGTDLTATLATDSNTSKVSCLLPPIGTTSNCLLHYLFLLIKLVFGISRIIFHWLVAILALQELEENGMKAEDSTTSTVYMLVLRGWRQQWFISTCKQHHVSEFTL